MIYLNIRNKLMEISYTLNYLKILYYRNFTLVGFSFGVTNVEYSTLEIIHLGVPFVLCKMLSMKF